ncbi:MAG: hypothetical protein IKU86_09720, partial [Thermoguttaceae bacterium]|nr:hypothetical protein [Thermoguttaceae bacterium]
MAKFRTVLLTLLIGNRAAASLLFLGFFCGIFVAQNVAVAADEKAAVGERKHAPYSNKDKTSEKAVRSEPLPLGRQAFERAEEEAERRRDEARTSTFESKPSVERTPLASPTPHNVEPAALAVDAPRVVRQNAYSGNVVFYELSNGLRVLLKKTTESRVGIRAVLRDAGSLGEREAAGTGLARLTAALVAEG